MPRSPTSSCSVTPQPPRPHDLLLLAGWGGEPKGHRPEETVYQACGQLRDEGAVERPHLQCVSPMHAGIAEMYVTDPRFTRTYEDVAPGLARYVRDAVVANAARD